MWSWQNSRGGMRMQTYASRRWSWKFWHCYSWSCTSWEPPRLLQLTLLFVVRNQILALDKSGLDLQCSEKEVNKIITYDSAGISDLVKVKSNRELLIHRGSRACIIFRTLLYCQDDHMQLPTNIVVERCMQFTEGTVRKLKSFKRNKLKSRVKSAQ